MLSTDIFETVIEPELARIPVLEIVHREFINDREVTLAHIIRRNVFTAFDLQLSRHLAAIRGRGFPRISVQTQMCDEADCGEWETVEHTSYGSIPAAMVGVADRAIGTGDSASLTIYQGSFREKDRETSAMKRELGRDDLHVMRQALRAARMFGESDFVEVAGDFDMIVIRPAGGQLPAVTIDLFNRMISIPVSRSNAAGADRLDAPLFDVERFIASTFEARAFMADAQRHLIAEKEIVVSEFRAAADDSILKFERALKGRPLTGHRQDAVSSLVARLKAGLGDALSGLSEDARITALDWSDMSEDAFEMPMEDTQPREDKPAQDWVWGKRAQVN